MSIYGYGNAIEKKSLVTRIEPTYKTNSSTYQKTSNNATQQQKQNAKPYSKYHEEAMNK